MLFLRIGLKNLVKYRKRSIITLLLSSVTTVLLIFASAFMDGSHQKMIDDAVEIYPGYLQITNRSFRDNPSYENLIFNTGPLRKLLSRHQEVLTFGERFESFVLLSAGERSVGVMLTGIEPSREKYLSRLAESLVDGEYLEDSDRALLYLGNELARRLRVKVGDKLSFVGSGADYSFAADIVTVKGIFQTGLFEFDSRTTFLNKKYFDELMASASMATHLVVLPQKNIDVPALAHALNLEIADKQYQAMSWQQIMADLVQAMKVDSIFGYITLGIFFIVIFFVIMIYTLLNVHSRVREIGVLRAVGTTPGQIFKMLISESIFLGLASVLLGGLLGGCLAYYFSLNPIFISGYEEQFKQYGLVASALPARFSLLMIGRDMVIMFFLSILSTLYPILRLNRYLPVEAMRHV